MSALPRSPKKHIRPGALCNMVAKKRKASLKTQDDWDDTLLGSPILKKKSSLRKFSAPVRVVVDSPPALSTRASTRRMVFNVEPDPNDDEENMERSLGSSKTKRSLNYEVDNTIEQTCEKEIREENEDVANEEWVGAECEEVAEVEVEQSLRKSSRLQHITDEANQTMLEEIPQELTNLTKKTRGKTLLANLTKRNRDLRTINWNEKGQPIGANSVQFSSFMGALVREVVPYTISDWRKISPLMKDVLWASIQVELQTL